MATHLSYRHANSAETHVTVDEIAKHGSVKRTLRLRLYLNRAIEHILIDIFQCKMS